MNNIKNIHIKKNNQKTKLKQTTIHINVRCKENICPLG